MEKKRSQLLWRSSMARRRPARATAVAAGCGLWWGIILMLTLILVSSTDAFPFKRKQAGADGVQQQQPGGISKGGKGKGGRRGKVEKVKEDVAWLLEDTSDGGWKPVRDDGRVQVWKRSMPNSDFVAIKSRASLAASPQALFEVLTPGDIEIVRQYNPLVEDGSDLEVMDRDNKVSWSATMGVWPCRPRDFVTHIRRAVLDDGSVAIVNSATIHPKAPASGKYVRGEILHGVFHIKAAKDKKHSEFTMVHHFNPGGNIPPWLINWLAEGKPLTFVRKLEEVARRWDKQAALTKSMPCKGRGFADKPCAFLLSAEDGSQDSDGTTSGSSGGWSTFRATLTMASLACCAWVACFGRPGALKEKEDKKEEACPPPVNAPVKELGEENGALLATEAENTLPAACEGPELTPTPEQPPTVAHEVRIETEEEVHDENVTEKTVVESLDGGETHDLEVVTGDSSSEQECAQVENGGGNPGEEISDKTPVAGEKEELVSSPAAAAAAAGATAEVTERGHESVPGADKPLALPCAQEAPPSPVCDGEAFMEEGSTGECSLAGVNKRGGEAQVEGGGDTGTPVVEDGDGEDGNPEVATASGGSLGKVGNGDSRGAAISGEDGGVRNGNVSTGDMPQGKLVNLSEGPEQLPAKQSSEGDAASSLDSLVTLGSTPPLDPLDNQITV